MNNLHILDRYIRIAIAVGLLFFAGIGFNMYFIMALFLFLTASFGYCPIYKVANINTKLEEKNKFLTQLPKHNPEPVFIFSQSGNLLYQNEASKKILPELKDFKNISSKDTKSIIEQGQRVNKKYAYKDTTYLIEAIGIKNQSYIVAYGFNITDIIKSKNALQQQTITDALTNLGNRTKLLQDIEKIANNQLSLFVFDVIKFSQINSFFGHKKGDDFLKQFATEIRSFGQSLKFQTDVYRLRGNTFALLIDFETSQSEDFTEEINHALFELFKNIKIEVGSIKTHIEIRVGIASKCTQKDENFICTSVLNNAETALSEAKKDLLPYLDFKDIQNINDRYKDNIIWANKLRGIFDGKGDSKLVAYFQPIYNIKNEKIGKFEALVRIVDKDKVNSPFLFLDVAKQINFLTKITREVLLQSLEAFKDTNFEFSLNLTTQDLKDKKHLESLWEELSQSGIKTSSVVLEILEDEDMYEYTQIIADLKSKGFKLAIDDFGTGYSNFQKLQQLNVDYLKIDGSLVKNIAKDPKNLKILQSICHYAQTIGVKTIAEFVADEDIYALVKQSGVDYAQGYFIGEPNPTLKTEFHV